MNKVVCVSCKIAKDESEFGHDTRKRNGLKSSCRACSAEMLRAWRAANPDKASKIEKRRYERNAQKRREKSRIWYEANKPRARENNIKWRADHAEEVTKYGREQSKAWREANPERAKENARNGQRRRREDGRKRMEDAIRSCISRSLRNGSKKGRSTFALLGYSPVKLREHLERQFQPGMTWENYGEWHIDHIKPLAAHNYETPDDIDFKRAWALSNLQPLWGSDNQSKGAKLNWQGCLRNGQIWRDGAANDNERKVG